MKLIITFFFTSLFFNPVNVDIEKWVIERNSSLYISGKSNVAGFQCDVGEYLNADTLSFYKEGAAPSMLTVKGGLVINVNSIDCHQRYMTSDLRKTMKADKEPQLKIELLTIGNFTLADSKNIKGLVNISLAGVTRKMIIDYNAQVDKKNNIQLCGSRNVLFADFGLTPPSKLAGLIKVDQQLQVVFRLVLRPVSGK